jgi:hypothetical protein
MLLITLQVETPGERGVESVAGELSLKANK